MNRPLRLAAKHTAALLRPNWPAYAVIFVTSRCNARCVMCFNWENVWDASKEDELTVAEYEQIARGMRPLTQLLLSGGEPFIRDDLPDIIAAFHRHAGAELVTIPTNAYLPKAVEKNTRRVLTECPGVYLNINLSIDGTSAVQDQVRGVKNQFPKILDSYQRLDRLRSEFPNLTLNAQTVISKYNIDEAEETIRYLRTNMKLDYHTFAPARGSTPEEDAKEMTVEQVERIYALAEGIANPGNGNFLFQRAAKAMTSVIRDTLFDAMKNEKRVFTCLAGRKMVVINHDGNVYPCEPLWLDDEKKKGFPEDALLGNLREVDLDITHLLKSEHANKVYTAIDKKLCHCMYGCAIYNSLLYAPSNWPRTIKKAISN